MMIIQWRSRNLGNYEVMVAPYKGDNFSRVCGKMLAWLWRLKVAGIIINNK